MKFPSLAVLAVWLLGAVAFAASESARPKGFAGIAWGANQADAITILRGRGLKLPEENEDPNVIVATGGSFANQEAAKWTFEFTGGKFSAATVVMTPGETASTLYRDFKQQFIAKYGPSAGEKKIGSTAEERTARYNGSSSSRLAKGNVVTWKFAPTLGDKNVLSIAVELNSGPQSEERGAALTVRYANETLRAGEKAGEKAAGENAEKGTGKAGKPEPPKTTRPVKVNDL